MGNARYIVVGDVHGCLEELDELLVAVEYRAAVDQLVFVGDLVDRGPDPVGVVRRARELRAAGVLGNHEEKHLRYAKHEARRRAEPGYRNPMRFSEAQQRANAQLSADDLAWLAALPLTLRLGPRWLVVHAGLEPGRPLEAQQASALIRVRNVDARGFFVTTGNPRVHAAGSVPWATRWRGPESVIYGHRVFDLAAPRVDTPAPDVACWGIDTGCCFGGRLTGLIWPALTIVQVAARAAYLPLRLEAEE